MTNIMDKFTQFLEEKLMPVAVKVANQRHLAAIKDGMVITLPFICIFDFRELTNTSTS